MKEELESEESFLKNYKRHRISRKKRITLDSVIPSYLYGELVKYFKGR